MAALWKSIYEQENVAPRTAEIAAESDGITFDLESYGKVQLLVKPASAVGDNFMSDTYYNTAVLSNGVQHRAFVKVLPSNPLLRAAAADFQVYDREIASYCHLHPLLRQIRNEAGLTHEDLALQVPEIYYTSLDGTKGNGKESSTVVVMEELSSQGFKMTDKVAGCSAEEAKMTLAALANYHALTFMMLRKYQNADGSHSLPPSVESVLHSLDFENMMVSMVNSKVPMFVKMIRHFGHNEDADWLEGQMDKSAELFRVKKMSELGPLAVICHGDIWNNNILYRYDETTGKVKDVRLVDWQVILPENPGRDVYHFLTCSTTPELRKENGQQLFDHYITVFLSALEKLGVPLVEEGIDHLFVSTEFKKRTLFALFQGIIYLPGILETKIAEKLDVLSRDEATMASFAENEMEALQSDTFDINFEELLANEILCQRLIYLVQETRVSLEQL